MNFVVVLQNGIDVLEGEICSYSETGVTWVDGTEEVSIKVEDDLDIKEEFSIKVEEAIDMKDEIPPIGTEQEVRLWGVCQLAADYCFKISYGHKKEL